MQPKKNNFRCNATQACDPCKLSKYKCDRLDQSTKCSRCTKKNSECTYLFQQEKRGPKPRKRSPRPPKRGPKPRKPTPNTTSSLSNNTHSHNNDSKLSELIRDLFWEARCDLCEI
ncbi:6743_t:CDS:1 [Cetraspora pellucida]|uniref:6743_t:CDS:1 n=1 Tax=Cetraspora pellucida TaxID=1433469 RepID=A0A9N9F0T1_9GLOM|nr:6743_t:CDS:1 [Cetraspora pellucida]